MDFLEEQMMNMAITHLLMERVTFKNCADCHGELFPASGAFIKTLAARRLAGGFGGDG